MLAYVKSDVGRVRDNNEDSFAFVPPHLFVVADGMGGHAAGEVASKLVTTILPDFMQKHRDVASSLELLLSQAIAEANQAIYQLAREQTQYAGMGTTATAVYIDNNTIYWGHVGDSRIYLIHNQTITQITQDHSLVWELVQNGSITAAEALTHPQRNIITRAVGTAQHITVDSGISSWQDKDRLLLCSDGLTNMVSETGLLTLAGSGSCAAALDLLVEEANHAGGIDNITAILLQNGD